MFDLHSVLHQTLPLLQLSDYGDQYHRVGVAEAAQPGQLPGLAEGAAKTDKTWNSRTFSKCSKIKNAEAVNSFVKIKSSVRRNFCKS